MAYDVLALKQDLIAVLHGTSLNQIQSIDALIYRAARDVLMDVDPQETIKTVQFANPLYDQVYDYAIPVDLKGNSVIDIRPQVNRTPLDIFGQQYNQAFDVSKAFSLAPSFTINFNGSVKTIRINAPQLNTGITINEADSTTSNGTWTATARASNLQTDNLNFVAGSGSLSFDLSAGGAGSTGYLEDSTMVPVDLTTHLNQGQIFLYTYLPVGSDFSNINIRFGSSSANYYSINATADFAGNAFQNGWNLIAFDFSSATTTGTPDITAVDYVRVTWTYNGTAQTSVRLDNIVSRLGSIFEIEYYSKYFFRDAITLAFQETVTDDSNLINLDTETYDLLFHKLGSYAVQQQQGLDATFFDSPWFENKYQETLARYKAKYKSQLQKPQATYYKQPNPNYSRYFGRFRNP